jgi:flagellar biosynthesis protein FliP
MSLLNYFILYFILFIGFPIVAAIFYDLKKKYSKQKFKKFQKIKEKESQWESFILDKYEEMKIWNPDIKYEDIKKYVLKSIK